MMNPEEQDSQIVDLGYEVVTDMPSSPPDRLKRDPTRDHHNSDDALSDTNVPREENQHESLGSRVEETQFSILERESQVLDEPFSNTTRPSQTNADTRATIASFDLPAFTIERPKDPNLEDDAQVFKFSKAQKAPKFPQLGRHPVKGPDGNTAPNGTTPAGTGKQHASGQLQSKVQQTSLTLITTDNVTVPSPPKMTVPADNRKECRPPAITQTPRNAQLAPNRQGKENIRDSSRQQVPRNIHELHIPTPKPAPLLESPAEESHLNPQQSVPHKSASKTANKSNKQTTMKQPFPEVSNPPPRRRTKSGSGSNRRRAAADSQPLRLVDVNRLVLDATLNSCSFEPVEHVRGDVVEEQEHASRHFHASINAPGHQGSRSSLSHDNAAIPQQIEVRNNPDQSKVLSIQAGPTRGYAANVCRNNVQQEPVRIPSQLETVVPRHHHHDVRESLPPVDAHKPHVGHSKAQSHVNEERRHASQPPSQPQSRPHSALSNTAKPMVRPLPADDLSPQGVSAPSIIHFKHPMKVQKPTIGQTHAGREVKSRPQANSQQQDLLATVASFRGMLDYLPGLEEALKDYEHQKEDLELKVAEVETLKLSTTESNKQIRRLEGERAALTSKVQKFTEISARYKAHMNDVVAAQKHLMTESTKIKAESAKVREESKAALKACADRDAQEEKLRNLINHVRGIRPPVEKLEELEKENAQCKTEIEKAGRTNQLLQSELNARMLDLGRERHNTEQLQKSLNAQSGLHKELVEIVKKTQLSVVDELTKEGSVLANVVNSENSIQTKIDKLSAFISTVNNREPKLPPALIKLIDDLYIRIENKLQATENQDAIISESNIKLFEDLKERINQLRLDEEAKTSLNGRISELKETNAALTASASAREAECQGVTKQIEELKGEISSCRQQLTTQSDELNAVLALPKEDPILRGKIHELENDKKVLQGQLNTANQEASRSKEELVSCRETVRSAQEQSQELQGKLTEAQTTIKSLAEDKKKYLASQQAEIDKAKQEVAKIANAQKAEAKLKHDCLVKNLEQRRSEAEKELALAQEELQKGQEERATYNSNLNKVQQDLSSCKKQLTQQFAFIKQASQRIPTRDEFGRREGKLQQAFVEMAGLKAHVDAVQKQTSQKVKEAHATHQNEVDNLIKRIDALESEKVLMEEQKSGIQKTYDTFKANIDRGLRQSGVLAAKLSVDEWASIPVHTLEHMGPPAVPMPKLVPSQRRTSLSDGDALSRSTPGTPKDTLRQSEMKLASATQRISSLQHIKVIEAQKSSADATPDCVQLPRSRSTSLITNSTITQSIVEASTTSPSQVTPKQLRIANRKSSGLAQSAHIEKVMNSFDRLDGANSTPNSVPSSSAKPSASAQTPTAMTPLSAGVSHISSSLKASVFVQPEQIENAGKSSRPSTARTEEQSMTKQTPTDTPAFSKAPFLPSSSPLSNLVSPVDQLGYNEEEFGKTQTQTKASKVALPIAKGSGRSRIPMQAANTAVSVGVKFKDTPKSHQFSDDDDYSGVNSTRNIKPPVPSITEESARRRQPQNLKSALRSKSKARKTNMPNDPSNDVFQLPISTPIGPTLQNKVPRATANSNPAHLTRKVSVGSTYNRIASGTKPESNSQASGAHSSVHKSSTAKGMVSNVERSPLIAATKRNSRKRSGSAPPSQPPKPFKQPRISLPHQDRKESLDVIPDSQEAPYRY